MGQKVLIVDDEAHIRLLIQQTLEELEERGVEILTAANGEQALEMIQADKPDLIFLDVMLPKMNGFDVCDRVRNAWGMRDVYIVMLTAKGQEFDRQKGERVGANVYMTKPFDPDELLRKAVEVLAL